MIRPNETDVGRRLEAWLAYIEKEILLSPVRRVYLSDVLVVTINHQLPSDLIDAIDDELKASGWRLHRPPHDYHGGLMSPAQEDSSGNHYFDVVEDKPCKSHRFRLPAFPRYDPPAFCMFCGIKQNPTAD